MPKSSSSPDDSSLLRKKKNADAQAAFRARRQNYISTLEETGRQALFLVSAFPLILILVTSLESVVIQLQESCRETRSENLQLRQENSRLRNREREKYWRTFVQTRKSPIANVDSPFSAHSSTLLQQQQHQPESFNYSPSNPSPSQPYDATTTFGDQHPPPVPFTTHDQLDPHPNRAAKYAAYPYPISDSPRDPRWQLHAPLPHSPSYIQSPSLTAPSDFPPRFPANDRKVALDAVLSAAPYVFPPSSSSTSRIPESSIPNSRSMSPTNTSATGSATSLPLTSSYQLAFHEGNDHTEFEYHGQSLPQVTLHGGIADISIAHPLRFPRRSDDTSQHQHLPMLPPNNDTTLSQHHDDSSSSIATTRHHRRNNSHPYRRSQSPGPTPLSSTVAVIKAQAFGALRRTRAKSKKMSSATDSAARVAQDVLEARGIGVGVSDPMQAKRTRTFYEGDHDVGNP